MARQELVFGMHVHIGMADPDEAIHVAGAITPVPGGVGPMTIACLLANTLSAARMEAARSKAAEADVATAV